MIVLDCNPLNQINIHDYIDIHGWMNGGEGKVLSCKKIPINRCRRNEQSTKLQNTKWGRYHSNNFYRQDPQNLCWNLGVKTF